MIGDNATDTELLRTLQVQLRKYQQLLTNAINGKATAATLSALTRQRDNIKMQIADVTARLKQADDPSSALKRLDEGAQELGSVLKFGGTGLLIAAIIIGAVYASGKAKGAQSW